ncbi:MAG TPA: ankyrin repeat domain-containing protein [Vicinamibacterales bacterium]
MRLVVLLAIAAATLSAAADTRLAEAAKRGDRAAVQTLVAAHADLNAPDAEGATAAHWAAENDDLAVMDALIRGGARLDAANRLGVPPITLAARNGSAPMLEKLLRAGVDPNATAGQGETALMTAARTGRADAVRTLVEWGADPNAVEQWRGQTALMWAVGEGHLEAARVLIDYGADLGVRSTAGSDALFFAVRRGEPPLVDLLLGSGADVRRTTADGMSMLVVAITNAHWDLAARLLDKGADANSGAPNGTPLHSAIRVRNPDAVALPDPAPSGDSLAFIRALIAHGAKVNAPLTRGQTVTFLNLAGATPFLLAAQAVDVPLMQLLVERGADPTITTKDKSSALMAAAGLGYDEGRHTAWTEAHSFAAVKLVLDLGADVNAIDDNGNTALHGAAFTGANSVVKLLVEKGARLDVKDKLGYLPVTIAEGIHIAALLKYRPETAVLLRELMERNTP